MQVDQEGQGEQPTEEEKMNNSGSKVQYMERDSLMLFIATFKGSCHVVQTLWFIKVMMKHISAYIFSVFLKDGDKQDQGASSSKAKSKVKSVDLPILANTTRQLDRDVLNHFVEYEVSHNSLSVCLTSLENVECCN